MHRPATLFLTFVIIACSTKDKESIARGEQVYAQYCVACHMKSGSGAAPMNPPLKGTSFVKGDPKILTNILLKGMSQQDVDGERYDNVMPPMDYLTDEQIADVLTYVRVSFGNSESAVDVATVKSVRDGK